MWTLTVLACNLTALPLMAQSFPQKISIGAHIKMYFEEIELAITSTPLVAEAKLEEVLPLLNQTNYGVYWGKYHELSGLLALQMNNPEKAIISFFDAAKAYHKSRNYAAESHVYLNLGNIFHQQRNHLKAIDYYRTGLAIFKNVKAENIALQVLFYECLGRCNLELNYFHASLEYLRYGEQLAKKTKLLAAQCRLLQLLGQNLYAQRSYALAQESFLQAYNLAHAQGLVTLEMAILESLNMVNYALKDFDQSKFFALKRKELSEIKRDTDQLNLSNYLIAKAYLAKHQYDSALTINTLALKAAINRGRDSIEREIWIQQGDILAQKNQNYAALLALEKAHMLDESIASNTQRLKAERLRQEMTIHRAEKQEHQRFETQLKKERLIRYLMFLALLIAALISLFYLFKVRIRQKANQQQLIQNEEIESQRKQLEQLNQIKDQLFAVISHDLRSPLWAIQAVLDTLNEPDLSQQERKHWLELLHQQTAKTSIMLENLLYWAKIQMNSYEPVHEEFELQPIVTDLSEAVKLVFAEKSVHIKNEISTDFTLKSDPGMIRMALRNIIANAVKFSQDGQVVEIRAQKENMGWTIHIKDFGIGMSEEQLEKALKGQLSRFGTKGEVGSGIGLSLVRQFIENYGGELRGQSKINQGCHFTLILPAKRA